MKKTSYCISVFIVLVYTSCTGRQAAIAKLFSDPANGLQQVKSHRKHTIAMEVLPNNAQQVSASNGNGILKIKLTLRADENFEAVRPAMDYMNFGIRNSFRAVMGKDTLPCIACERIPGINENEFLYLAIFDNHLPQTDLQLLVTDTIAGFGSMVFSIKKNALEKLEALK